MQQQKQYFHNGHTKEVTFRIRQLKNLKKALQQNEKAIMKALRQDLNKSEFEAYLTEVGFLYKEINEAIKNVKNWSKPHKVKTTLTHMGAKGVIYPEPYGVSLIISPWNYPVNLTIAPLIGAISAGCCAIVKPSEQTPHTSHALTQIINNTFDPEYIVAVEGAVQTSEALLELNFDHIFFTGSEAVGKIVMEKAAQHLTPVTLELGGKSPTVVHHDAQLDMAAKRLAWGKWTNAGQTCVAPDYLIVHQQVKAPLLKALVHHIQALYGTNVLENEDYPMIVNDQHVERLSHYLGEGDIYYGGEMDKEKRVIGPTIIENVSWDSSVMRDEIFGPILPVFVYEHEQDVIEMIRKRPHPLALYLFTESDSMVQYINSQFQFGGGCVNDVLYHLGTSQLPFGGVGSSGMGAYHGKHSFDAFTHHKSLLHQSTKFDIPLRYGQMKAALNILKKLIK
nr:aldehyde dehydrogenase [Caldalkalibacillus salinus]